MVQIDDLINNVPPVTRVVLGLSIALAVLCTLELLSPLSLYMNWDLVIYERQWWRLLSCFFFFGDFSIHFCWNMFIYRQYCGSLEELAYRGRSADFVWLLLTSGALLLVITAAMHSTSSFLSTAMMEVMIYLWSKKNPAAMVHVLFLTVQAAYLPFVLVFLSLLMGGSIMDYLLGIAVGHIYYFFTDIYPLMPTSGGFQLFRTPYFLKKVLRQSID